MNMFLNWIETIMCVIFLIFQGQNAQMHGLGQAQRALLGTISDGLSALGDAQGDLEQKANLPPLGTDPVSSVFWNHLVSCISLWYHWLILCCFNAIWQKVFLWGGGGGLKLCWWIRIKSGWGLKGEGLRWDLDEVENDRWGGGGGGLCWCYIKLD